MNLLNDYQQDKFDKVQRKEDLIDKYESRLGEYLVQLTKRDEYGTDKTGFPVSAYDQRL